MPSKEPYLPADVVRGLEYTLVLDLDETLVHFDPVRLYLNSNFFIENPNLQTKALRFEIPLRDVKVLRVGRLHSRTKGLRRLDLE